MPTPVKRTGKLGQAVTPVTSIREVPRLNLSHIRKSITLAEVIPSSRVPGLYLD